MGILAKRVDRHVGERIRRRRTSLGLTQEDLASALQISYQQVQKYETGANRVSAGRLYEISNRLDVEVSHFFDELDADAEPAPAEHGGKNRSVIEVAQNFADIKNPAVRSAVAGLIKSIVAKEV